MSGNEAKRMECDIVLVAALGASLRRKLDLLRKAQRVAQRCLQLDRACAAGRQQHLLWGLPAHLTVPAATSRKLG